MQLLQILFSTILNLQLEILSEKNDVPHLEHRCTLNGFIFIEKWVIFK